MLSAKHLLPFLETGLLAVAGQTVHGDELPVKTLGTKSHMGFLGPETSYKCCCIFTAGGRMYCVTLQGGQR